MDGRFGLHARHTYISASMCSHHMLNDNFTVSQGYEHQPRLQAPHTLAPYTSAMPIGHHAQSPVSLDPHQWWRLSFAPKGTLNSMR